MTFDALIIGCGLSGAVVARHLAEQGKRVEIWERRSHVGGNMFDEQNEHGILVHRYGPHTFHTKKAELFRYMQRFEEWEEYHLTCMSHMLGKFTPSPFNFKTIDDYYPPEKAEQLKQALARSYPEQETATVVELLEHPDPLIREYAQFLFDRDYSLYTAKQWGVSPSEIDVSVLRRVPVRFSYRDGYFDDEFQAMPRHSYVRFFENLLDHPKLTVRLKTEALERLSADPERGVLTLDGEPAGFPVIYTGPVDELFDRCFGALPYRSLRFEWKTLPQESFQDAPVVAYPEAEGYTRITEYKKLPVQKAPGVTSIAVEYPLAYTGDGSAEPYYPILTQDSQALYERYRALASRIPNLTLCGRLADFKYYNMDQALERALAICAGL